MTHTTYPNEVHVTIDKHLLQETLIALRDRRTKLMREQQGPLNMTVRAISEQQLIRVQDAGLILASSLGESF